MYFDGACYETLHRAVYFTNVLRTTADNLSLPVGELQFSTDGGSVMISATDRLPKKDGTAKRRRTWQRRESGFWTTSPMWSRS